MIYDIIYSAEARQDLREIYQYIGAGLMEPDAAAGQVNRIMKSIRTLNEMPMRHRIYEEEPWHSLELRVLTVDNYLIFYFFDEIKGIVNIVRIMYGRRDVKRQLRGREIRINPPKKS